MKKKRKNAGRILGFLMSIALILQSTGLETLADSALPADTGSVYDTVSQGLPDVSGDSAGEETALPGVSGDNAGEETDLPGVSGDNAEEGTDLPGVSGDDAARDETTVSETYYGMNWTLDQNGALIVSGSYDEAGESSRCWSECADNIVTVKVTATGVQSMDNWFEECHRLESVDLSEFDASAVTSMCGLFLNCDALETVSFGDSFTTANVTDMSQMFCGCSSLKTLDLGKFDTASVTNMSFMFGSCSSLESLNVGNFDTAEVSYAEGMFAGCAKLSDLDLSSFDMTNVYEPSEIDVEMFEGCNPFRTLKTPRNLSEEMQVPLPWSMEDAAGEIYDFLPHSEQSLELFLHSSEENGEYGKTGGLTWQIDQDGNLFIEGAPQEGDRVYPAWLAYREKIRTAQISIPYVDANASCSLKGWFAGCSSLTSVQFTEDCNLYWISSTADMFRDCGSLTEVVLTGIDLNAVEDMSNMFRGCSSLISLDFSNTNFRELKDATGMFRDCTALTEIKFIHSDNTGWAQPEYMTEMFAGCGSLTGVDLSGFDVRYLRDAEGMFDGCDVLEWMDTPQNIDSMDAESGILLPRTLYDERGNAYDSLTDIVGGTIRLKAYEHVGTYRGMNWFLDKEGELTVSGIYSYYEADPGEGESNPNAAAPGWTEYAEEIRSAVVTATQVESFENWFNSLTRLESVDLSKTGRSTSDVNHLFAGCTSLKEVNFYAPDSGQTFWGYDVTDIGYMFAGCENLTGVDLGECDLSSVKNGEGFFEGCAALQEVDTPLYLGAEIALPHPMEDEYGNRYTFLPWELGYSVHLTATSPETWAPVIYSGTYYGMQWSIHENLLLEIDGTYIGQKAKGDQDWRTMANKLKVTSVLVTADGIEDARDWFNGMETLKSADLMGADFNDSSAGIRMDRMFAGCSSLEEVRFGISYIYKATMSGMFSGCSSLKVLDMGWLEFGVVSANSTMLQGCDSLEHFFTPKNFTAKGVALPYPMYDEDGVVYEQIPTRQAESIHLSKEPVPAVYCGMTWSVDLTTKLLTISGEYVDDGNAGQDLPPWNKIQYTSVKVTAENVNSTANWFQDATALKTADLSGFDTSQVTDMSNMFSGCTALASLDMSGCRLDSLTKAEGMLAGCGRLTLIQAPVGLTLEVPLVRPLYQEEVRYEALPENLQESVTLSAQMAGTFGGMTWQIDEAGTLTVSGTWSGAPAQEPGWLSDADFITEAKVSAVEVTDMKGWFAGCSSLTKAEIQEIRQVTDMSRMFEGCSSLTTVIFGSGNAALKNMNSMFAGCSALGSLDLSGFELQELEDAEEVFTGCVSLTMIKTPIGLHQEVALPTALYDADGTEYTCLPKEKGESVALALEQKKLSFEIGQIPDQTYTGKALKPEVTVSYGDVSLVKGQDYTVSYKNNTNAASADAQKAPTVTIKGKGSYNGSISQTFTIQPMELKLIGSEEEDDGGYDEEEGEYAPSPANTKISSMVYTYDGKKKNTAPSVTVNGKKLNKNSYTVIWGEEGAEETEGDFRDPGTYPVAIVGQGNYCGRIDVSLVILEEGQVPASKLSIASIPAQKYSDDGEVMPEPAVKYKNRTLELGVDYEFSYRDNDRVGKATLILIGLENTDPDGVYVYGTAEKTFSISGTSLKTVKFGYPYYNEDTDEEGVKASYTAYYTGEEIIPEYLLYTRIKNESYDPEYDDPADQWETVELEQDTDYTLTCINNINAGKATLKFTGIGRYTGTLTKTFTIKPLTLKAEEAEDRVNVEVLSGEAVPYSVGGSKPQVLVTVDDMELVNGRDYTVSYENNKAIADEEAQKAPTVKVKGKGNYSFTKKAAFCIVAKDLSEEDISVTAPDKFEGAKSFLSTPVVTDENGKKLKVNRDYQIEGYFAGDDELNAQSKLQAGTEVIVKIRGIGSYTGNTQAVYRVAARDISKVKATPAKLEYNGGTVEYTELMIESGMLTITYTDKKKKIEKEPLVYGTDYIITGYKNNTKRGTGVMTIQGIGQYGGTKSVKFTIQQRKLQK